MANLTEWVEVTAEMRGDPAVPREYIERALALIKNGKEAVEVYPNGQPSMKDVYDIAARLEAAVATKN